jgi:HEPN domain-containing protein
METTPGTAKNVQDYYALSVSYLKSAEVSLVQGLYEPAMFSALHALELALKAALLTKTEDAWKTHNVGGQFGRYFREEVGDECCHRINRVLTQYNLPRYPSVPAVDPSTVQTDIAFISDVIKKIGTLLKNFS